MMRCRWGGTRRGVAAAVDAVVAAATAATAAASTDRAGAGRGWRTDAAVCKESEEKGFREYI